MSMDMLNVEIPQDHQSQPITRPEIKLIIESLKYCFFQVYKVASLKPHVLTML